jgi:anti-anti-sigma factor
MAEPLGWVEVATRDDVVIVRINGEVDMSNVAQIGTALEEATGDRGARYFVDLTETRYLDSSGIRLLFVLATRLKTRRQEIGVIAPEGALTRRVLELCDLPRMVPFLSSSAEIDGPPASG